MTDPETIRRCADAVWCLIGAAALWFAIDANIEGWLAEARARRLTKEAKRG